MKYNFTDCIPIGQGNVSSVYARFLFEDFPKISKLVAG